MLVYYALQRGFLSLDKILIVLSFTMPFSRSFMLKIFLVQIVIMSKVSKKFRDAAALLVSALSLA